MYLLYHVFVGTFFKQHEAVGEVSAGRELAVEEEELHDEDPGREFSIARP